MCRRMMTDSDSCSSLVIGSGTISTLYLVVESVTATLVSKHIAKPDDANEPKKKVPDLWLSVKNKSKDKKKDFEKVALKIIEQIKDLKGETDKISDIQQAIELLREKIAEENESKLSKSANRVEVQLIKQSKFYKFAIAAWNTHPNTETAQELKIAIIQLLLINQNILSLTRLRNDAEKISLFHQTDPEVVKAVYSQLETIYKIRHKTQHFLDTETLTIEKETLTTFFRAVQSVGGYYATLLADDDITKEELKALKQLLELIDLPKKLKQQTEKFEQQTEKFEQQTEKFEQQTEKFEQQRKDNLKRLEAIKKLADDGISNFSNSAPPGQVYSGPSSPADAETSGIDYCKAEQVEDTSVDQLSDDDAEPVSPSCAPKKLTEDPFPESPGKHDQKMDVDYKCLYVKGLVDAVTENDLKPLFEASGPVITVKKLSPATAIVSYTDADHARNAIDKLDGSRPYNKAIHVEFKTKKTQHPVPKKAIPVALHVLWYLSVNHRTKSVLTNLKASLDFKNSCISIGGNSHSVDETTREIKQLVGSVSESHYGLSDIFQQCFKQLKPAEIVEVFKSHHIVAGWALRDGQLHTCSDSVHSAGQSLDLIWHMILEFKYPTDKVLSSEQINLVADCKWIELRDQLKAEDLTKSLEIGYDHSLKKVVFAIRSEGNSDAVNLALEQFFDSVSGREKTVAIDAETARLSAKNQSSIQKWCCQEGVTIDFNSLSSLYECTVKSSSNDLLDAAVSKLNSVIGQAVKKEVSFSKRSTVEWLKSTLGCSKLADITSLTHTLSATTTQKVRQRVYSDNCVPASVIQAAAGSPSNLVQEKPKSAQRVKVVKGDITTVETDGLVSCHGAVAMAITTKFGPLLQSRLPPVQYSDKGLFVYHIHLEEWHSSQAVTLLDELYKQVMDAFRSLSACGTKAIAIPAIGTGGLGYPPEKVAASILKALITSLDDHSDLKVLIVIHPQANIHKVFEDELDKYKPKPAPRTVFSPALTDIVVEELTITFTGLKETDVTTAVSKLQEEIEHAFPSHWDQQALAKGQHEVKLDRHSEEYGRVSWKFFETCQIVDIQISEITRIQNVHLYIQYEAQKSKIKRELSGDKTIEIERQLWHGATAESVKQICANEFNRSFPGAHGKTNDRGSYFSTSSEYSVRYSEGQIDRYMILAKVATGRYQKGSRDTRRNNLPAEIHSTVNIPTNPTIFVVYHDASAYPEYVIKFTKKK